jgi:hypothetical protein
MRGLAEFVMRGRKQAILASVCFGLLPLINLFSPVLVGLVLLRKGAQEALSVFVWAILPLIAWTLVGDFVPVLMLIGVYGLAWILRRTESWEYTLIAAIGIGLGVEGYLRFQPAVLDLVFQQLEPYLSQNNVDGFEVNEIRGVVISIFGSVYMFLGIVLTMLARWMQAKLYNPGGFQKEFHQLRMEHRIALLLLGFIILASFEILIPQAWVLFFTLPLVFSGISLAHAVCEKRRLPSLALVMFYVLLLLPITVQIIVFLALIDSWYDFRKKLERAS